MKVTIEKITNKASHKQRVRLMYLHGRCVDENGKLRTIKARAIRFNSYTPTQPPSMKKRTTKIHYN